jgi:hypothetical protein
MLIVMRVRVNDCPGRVNWRTAAARIRQKPRDGLSGNFDDFIAK